MFALCLRLDPPALPSILECSYSSARLLPPQTANNHEYGICGSHRRSFSTPEGWLFANPVTGRPYHQEEIQKKHIRKAGVATGIGGDIGWHTFRHSYRSWLDETGAPLTVQKELMRHASIQTTMIIYGKAMTDSKRQAHSKVVEMVLKSSKLKETVGRNDAVAAIGS
jgi:integrase